MESDRVPGAPAGIRLTVEPDRLAVLALDGGDDEAFVFSLERLHRLESLLDELERWIADGSASALLVRLGVRMPVATDLDIDEVRRLPDEAAARAWASEGQRIVQRLEDLPVPTVAAIAGGCLWAGTQIALACTHRLALGSRRTRLGLPEARLGILPAWGGSVRLPRRIGVRAAADLLLHRETVSARRAGSLGLVDDVFPPASFAARVRRFALRHADRGRGAATGRRGLATRVVEDTAPGRRLVLARAARNARRGEALPGRIVDAVLHTLADGVALPRASAFGHEVDGFATLLTEGVPRALLNAHGLLHVRSPSPGHRLRAGGSRVTDAAVLGAGTRGTYLAHLLAGHGVSVRLKDRDREAVARAARELTRLFAWEVDAGLCEEGDADRKLRRVHGTTGFGGFGRAEVVLEAVPDRAPIKRAALREVEEHVHPSCVLLTTSPLLTVSELQEGLARPELLAGLHFFHPGGRRGLAEVVRGSRTAEATVSAACALARQLGKTPIVVGDVPGLVSYRLTVPYLNEALHLLAEGVPAGRIERVTRRFGMPVGPLRLLAELGVGAFEHAAHQLATRLGDRLAPPPDCDALLRRAAAGRSGRGAITRRLAVWPRTLLRTSARTSRVDTDDDDALQRRLLLAMINEAARLLEERVVPGAADVDRALLLAIGFPAVQGGLLFQADRLGVPAVVDALSTLEARHGPRFAPAPLLVHLAAQGSGFYGAAAATGMSAAPAAVPAAGQTAADVLT